MMATFDAELWRERARARMEKSQNNSRSKYNKHQYARDLLAIAAISTVIEWCNKRSLVVEFTNGSDGKYDSAEQKIEINGRSLPETQFYWLIHECGHFLIDNSGTGRTIFAATSPTDQRSLTTRIAYVDEEFEAWKRGRRLAERLGIFINQQRFDQHRARALATYLRWATRTLS